MSEEDKMFNKLLQELTLKEKDIIKKIHKVNKKCLKF
jgi:hypothetical protein